MVEGYYMEHLFIITTANAINKKVVRKKTDEKMLLFFFWRIYSKIEDRSENKEQKTLNAKSVAPLVMKRMNLKKRKELCKTKLAIE